MDQGAFSFSVCFTLICLLGTVRCSNSDNIAHCPCPEIPSIPPTKQAEPPPKTCFQINNTYRYKCKGDNLRKAGTSNLIRCEEVDGVATWTPAEVSLQCIRNPKIKTTTAPPPPPEPNITQTTRSDPETDRTDNPIEFSTVFPIGPSSTVTAFTSLQTNQGTLISTSVKAETDSAKPTSPDHVPEINATERKAISTTTELSNNSSVNTPGSISAELSRTTTALVSASSVVIICALIGFSVFLSCKKKSKSNTSQPTPEEEIPMNNP